MSPAASQAPPPAAEPDDDRQLIARNQGLRLLREERLLMVLLSYGTPCVLTVLAMQVLLGYPPERHIVLAMSALSLALADWLHHRGRSHLALSCLMGGVFAAVATQTLVAGSLGTPALFALPFLLMVTGTLLGNRASAVLLLGMITLLCALALRESPDSPVSAPGLRALVLGLMLILGHIFLRVWQRGQSRDSQAIEALNERLTTALQRERALMAETERLQQTLASCRSAYAEALAQQQDMQRLLLALPPSSAPRETPVPLGEGRFELRSLVREMVQEQASRLQDCGLILDLESDVHMQCDAATLRTVLHAMLQAALQGRPRQLRLHAGLLGLDVIDIELQAEQLETSIGSVHEAELLALRHLQGTLSMFDEDEGRRWRLLMPRMQPPPRPASAAQR